MSMGKPIFYSFSFFQGTAQLQYVEDSEPVTRSWGMCECMLCVPPSWTNSSAPLMCRHDRVTREVGRVGLGEEGILSGVVPIYLYCPASIVSVSLGV